MISWIVPLKYILAESCAIALTILVFNPALPVVKLPLVEIPDPLVDT